MIAATLITERTRSTVPALNLCALDRGSAAARSVAAKSAANVGRKRSNGLAPNREAAETRQKQQRARSPNK